MSGLFILDINILGFKKYVYNRTCIITVLLNTNCYYLIQVMQTSQWLYLVTEYASEGEIFG